MGSRGLTSPPASYPPPPPPRPLPNPQVTLPSTPPPPLSPLVAVSSLCRCVEHAPLWALWFLFSINYFRKKNFKCNSNVHKSSRSSPASAALDDPFELLRVAEGLLDHLRRRQRRHLL